MPEPARDADSITQVLMQDGNRVTLRARKVRVEAIAGPAAGLLVELPGPEIRVGNSRGADLILLDGAVSRHHLTLRVETAGIRVIDAGSRNGTLLDGVRVRDAYARTDSSLVVGNSTLRVRMLHDVVDLPLSSRQSFGALLGQSVAMRLAFTLLERVAPTDDTILLEGETGTGKELAAEAVHEHSARSGGPFVVFDCSAVSASLLESELFGHVRGAFSGAVADREGAFEAADGGTLFLDEIGELALELQPKLLRALERLEVRRVGSNTQRRVDVRIVAATNRNLAEEVTRGRFREDLYYRLAVVRLSLPPLRERPEDILLLARHFTAEAARRGRHVEPLPDRELNALTTQAWPGNVRELRNAVARALTVGPGNVGMPGPLRADAALNANGSAPISAAVDLSLPLKAARDRLAESFEAAYLAEALRETGGNITHAARLAGVNRKFIQRAIQRFDLRGATDDDATSSIVVDPSAGEASRR